MANGLELPVVAKLLQAPNEAPLEGVKVTGSGLQ